MTLPTKKKSNSSDNVVVVLIGIMSLSLSWLIDVLILMNGIAYVIVWGTSKYTFYVSEDFEVATKDWRPNPHDSRMKILQQERTQGPPP